MAVLESSPLKNNSSEQEHPLGADYEALVSRLYDPEHAELMGRIAPKEAGLNRQQIFKAIAKNFSELYSKTEVSNLEEARRSLISEGRGLFDMVFQSGMSIQTMLDVIQEFGSTPALKESLGVQGIGWLGYEMSFSDYSDAITQTLDGSDNVQKLKYLEVFSDIAVAAGNDGAWARPALESIVTVMERADFESPLTRLYAEAVKRHAQMQIHDSGYSSLYIEGPQGEQTSLAQSTEELEFEKDARRKLPEIKPSQHYVQIAADVVALTDSRLSPIAYAKVNVQELTLRYRSDPAVLGRIKEACRGLTESTRGSFYFADVVGYSHQVFKNAGNEVAVYDLFPDVDQAEADRILSVTDKILAIDDEVNTYHSLQVNEAAEKNEQASIDLVEKFINSAALKNVDSSVVRNTLEQIERAYLEGDLELAFSSLRTLEMMFSSSSLWSDSVMPKILSNLDEANRQEIQELTGSYSKIGNLHSSNFRLAEERAAALAQEKQQEIEPLLLELEVFTGGIDINEFAGRLEEVALSVLVADSSESDIEFYEISQIDELLGTDRQAMGPNADKIKIMHDRIVLGIIEQTLGIDLRKQPLHQQLNFLQFLSQQNDMSFERIRDVLANAGEDSKEIIASFLLMDRGFDYGDYLLDVAESCDLEQLKRLVAEVSSISENAKEFSSLFPDEVSDSVYVGLVHRMTEVLAVASEVARNGHAGAQIFDKFGIEVDSLESLTADLRTLDMAINKIPEVVKDSDVSSVVANAKGYNLYRFISNGDGDGQVLLYNRPEGGYSYDDKIEYGRMKEGVEASISFITSVGSGYLSPYKKDRAKDEISIRLDREGLNPEQVRDIANRDPGAEKGTITLDIGSILGDPRSFGTRIGRIFALGNILRSERLGKAPELNHTSSQFDQSLYGTAEGFKRISNKIEAMAKLRANS